MAAEKNQAPGEKTAVSKKEFVGKKKNSLSKVLDDVTIGQHCVIRNFANFDKKLFCTWHWFFFCYDRINASRRSLSKLLQQKLIFFLQTVELVTIKLLFARLHFSSICCIEANHRVKKNLKRFFIERLAPKFYQNKSLILNFSPPAINLFWKKLCCSGLWKS